MSAKRPGYAHKTVMQLEPGHGASLAGALIGLLVFGTAAAGALLYRTARWPESWPRAEDLPDRAPLIVAAVAGGLALLCLIAVIYSGRRWRTARFIERSSNDPRLTSFLPAPVSTTQRTRAATVPPLDVHVVKDKQLKEWSVKPRPIDDTRNVIGKRPLRIAYLRLFENAPRTRSFVEGAWREFGTVVALRSATSVTPAELKQVRRDGALDELFVDSPGELAAALANVGPRALEKGRHKIVGVAPSKVSVKDKYGCYPIAAVLCHGRFWRTAVDQLLTSVDLAVVVLSGYTDAHEGTQHELQRIVDRFPIERTVLLADPSSNIKFLVDRIHVRWSAMAEGSPNSTPTSARVALLAVTDRIARSTSTNSDGSTSTQVRLVSDRNQTRRLATLAQSRLAG